ncbi:MAG TPA: hypothetical protein VGE42_08575, partial [Candidatus Dormibacteraeota bacterium]
MRAIWARPLTSSFLLLLGLGISLVGLGAAPSTAAAATGEPRQPAIFHAASAANAVNTATAARPAQLELGSGERITPSLPAGAQLVNAAALGEHGWVATAL